MSPSSLRSCRIKIWFQRRENWSVFGFDSEPLSSAAFSPLSHAPWFGESFGGNLEITRSHCLSLRTRVGLNATSKTLFENQLIGNWREWAGGQGWGFPRAGHHWRGLVFWSGNHLEAPALVRWSSLLGPGPGCSARGPGAGSRGQLAGWVIPNGDSREAGWSPHPSLFPSLLCLCCLFPNQSLSWCIRPAAAYS